MSVFHATAKAASTAVFRPLRVGVVGLGTAGLAAAIFLRRQGHDVTVYERTAAESLDDLAGAGLGVQPIGLTVLRRLGVLDDVLAHGARCDRLHAVTREGRTVLDLSYADFRPELFGVGLHRDVLFSTLYNKAIDPNDAARPLQIVAGFNAATVEPAAAASSCIVAEDGTREGPFDLVVVADGRDSLRKSMPGVQSHESIYPYGCLWTILPDNEGVFTGRPELFQRLDSASTMLGFLPTGRTPDMSPGSTGLVSLFWSLEMRTVDAVRRRGLDAWKAEVVDLEPRAAGLMDGLTSFEDQLIPAGYSDTWMPKLYDLRSRCVFLGDCAHATSPQLGQGANLALVDAWVLGNVIGEATRGVPKGEQDDPVLPSLQEFDRQRRWRLRFYQLNSRMLTPVFQSNSRAIGALRDLFMGPLCKFPLSRLQMLTVLCGAQNNGIPWTTIPEEEFMGYTHIDELV